MNILIGFLFVISVNYCNSAGLKVISNVTDAEYYSKPPLFHLDHFEECMHLYDKPFYCYATIQLNPRDPKNPSNTWKIIERLIDLPRFYRHDRIRHGICIPKTCPDISKNDYIAGNGSENLWKQISKCYTDKYESYDLKGDVIKIHCQTDAPIYEIDYLDVIYAVLIGCLVLLILLGTIFEGCARNKSPEKYKEIISKTPGRRLLTCFAILRNWDRLTSNYSAEDAQALAPLQGVRVFNMYFVVSCHTIIFAMTQPSQNPQFTENTTLETLNAIYSNGGLTCQTFLLITGWLFSFSVCTIFENKKMKFQHIMLAIINRFMRLLPILLLSVGFSATWLRHMAKGPITDHVVGDEFRNCRKNWIWTVLFLNNYVDPAHMCLQQTWFLSSDTQAFMVGLFIMLYVLNNRQHAFKVFSFFILLGMSITFTQHYLGDYDIVFRSYPEIIYTLYLEYEQWLVMYAQGHHHLAAYVMGLAVGYYFVKFRRENIKLKLSNGIYYSLIVFMWVVPIGTILIASLFYREGFETTRFWAALHQGTNRIIFVFPIAMALFGFTNYLGGPMRVILAWPPFQTLGRLTFSVYLLHAILMRYRGSVTTNFVHLNKITLLSMCMGDFLLSYFIGLIGCLCVELPMSALQKILFESGKKDEKEKKVE